MSLRHYILTAAGGIALALAFPTTNLWQLAWVALVPLILSLHEASPRRAFASGLIFGLAFFGVLVHWVRLFGYLPWSLLVLVEALMLGLLAVAASVILRHRHPLVRMLGFAAAWVALDWLRSLGPASFTWGSIAYSQAYNLPVARLASITGLWGISFLVALVNAGLAEVLRERDGRRMRAAFLMPIILVTAALALGPSRHVHPIRRPLSVSVIQPCLAQSVRPPQGYEARQWNAYSNLTALAIPQKPDFIVWGESAVPADIDQAPWVLRGMQAMADASSADVVTGGVRGTQRGGQPKEQNGAYVISPRKGIVDRYFKVRLVPFGEYVPARKWLTIAERYGVRDVDYIPGPGWRAMRTSRGKIGAVICFESTFPQISRVMVKDGARLLFVLTNDGWFERTSAPEQHLQMAVFRAIEDGRYVVRGTTTGISAIIAPDGRITTTLALWRPGVMTGMVEALGGMTPYVRYGDWFAYLCVVVAAACGRACSTKTRRPR